MTAGANPLDLGPIRRRNGMGCERKGRPPLGCTKLARGWPRRGARVALIATLATAAGAAGWLLAPGANLGVVAPGQAYRCAQPKGNLAGLMGTYRPASILNLRGGTDADPWYVAEVAAARAGGVDFYDLPLSATRRPTRRELAVLIETLGRCRLPLLIHCKSGADRTGLASGLFLMARKGTPPAEALGAFSIRYGHIPLLGPEHLHEPFLEYDAWLRGRGLAHSAGRLRDWVAREYRAVDPPAEVPTLRPGPRVRVARGESTRR